MYALLLWELSMHLSNVARDHPVFPKIGEYLSKTNLVSSSSPLIVRLHSGSVQNTSPMVVD